MGNETRTLAEALPDEINRVREIQDQYKELRGRPNIIVEPAIMFMEHSIQNAIQASMSGDIVSMLKAVKDLKGFRE